MQRRVSTAQFGTREVVERASCIGTPDASHQIIGGEVLPPARSALLLAGALFAYKFFACSMSACQHPAHFTLV